MATGIGNESLYHGADGYAPTSPMAPFTLESPVVQRTRAFFLPTLESPAAAAAGRVFSFQSSDSLIPFNHSVYFKLTEAKIDIRVTWCISQLVEDGIFNKQEAAVVDERVRQTFSIIDEVEGSCFAKDEALIQQVFSLLLKEIETATWV